MLASDLEYPFDHRGLPYSPGGIRGAVDQEHLGARVAREGIERIEVGLEVCRPLQRVAEHLCVEGGGHHLVVGPRRIRDQDRLARLDQREKGLDQRGPATRRNDDLLDVCADPVTGGELDTDRLPHRWEAAIDGVLRVAVRGRARCGFDDVRRSREVGLADLET
jgi:hypothetical protein